MTGQRALCSIPLLTSSYLPSAPPSKGQDAELTGISLLVGSGQTHGPPAAISCRQAFLKGLDVVALKMAETEIKNYTFARSQVHTVAFQLFEVLLARQSFCLPLAFFY